MAYGISLTFCINDILIEWGSEYQKCFIIQLADGGISGAVTSAWQMFSGSIGLSYCPSNYVIYLVISS